MIVKVLRLIAGFALICSATAFLIEGGLSRYGRVGIPAHPDWRLIAIGLAMAGAGGVLIRPIKSWGRR